MRKAAIKKNGAILTVNAEVADSFFKRFMGLMFRKSVPQDFALYITPCNQIHMLNMRFAIDVIYLDAEGRTVKIDENVQPGKICKTVRKAENVIEMNAFAAKKYGIREGDVIEIVRDYQ